MQKLDAKKLRKTPPTEKDLSEIKRNPIYVVLDNVLDTYNIGSLFRLSDAIAAQKLILCGGTEYPPSSRIHKAAVGTEEWVPWEYSESSVDAIKKLKDQGIQIIAVEQDSRSISYKDLNDKVNFPCAIVIGHETDGVSKQVLDLADIIVELPMYGVNISLNVWGTAAVAVYKILENLK